MESKEVKDKQALVDKAFEEVKKAEALVKEDMAKGKTDKNDPKMQAETKHLEDLVKKAMFAVRDS